MNHTLIHDIRGLRAKVSAGAMTLDQAAAELVAVHRLTQIGARDYLTRLPVEIEASIIGVYTKVASALLETRENWTA